MDPNGGTGKKTYYSLMQRDGDDDDYDPENPLGLDCLDWQTAKLLTAMADHSVLECHCKDVGRCDGSNPGKMLAWLRARDRVPEEVRHA